MCVCALVRAVSASRRLTARGPAHKSRRHKERLARCQSVVKWTDGGETDRDEVSRLSVLPASTRNDTEAKAD
ncbi:hypothetical protein NHX12_013647 [Muraenolepis orangiensis]|uniref:Uncharacterized protein n=1 Tax=Muraenolepis orangiensis TaxID=630683 RepID=A0A9Q0DAK1_9TELE|nr:hypothetical protein NHX12_013647 [Muraenolepis orangiensis]